MLRGINRATAIILSGVAGLLVLCGCSRLSRDSQSLEYFCGVDRNYVSTDHVYLALFDDSGEFRPVLDHDLSFFPELNPEQARAIGLTHGCVILPREYAAAADYIVYQKQKIARLGTHRDDAPFQALDLKADDGPVDLQWEGCEAEPQAMRDPSGIRLTGNASGYLHAELRQGRQKFAAPIVLFRDGFNLSHLQLFQNSLVDGIYVLGGRLETPSGRQIDLGQRQCRIRIDTQAPAFAVTGLRPLMRPGEKLEARFDASEMAVAGLEMVQEDTEGVRPVSLNLLETNSFYSPSEGRWRLKAVLRDRASNEARWGTVLDVDGTEPVLTPRRQDQRGTETVVVSELFEPILSEPATVEACIVRTPAAQCRQSEFTAYSQEAIAALEPGDYTMLLRVTDDAGNSVVQSHKLVVPEGGYAAWCLRVGHTPPFIAEITTDQAQDCFSADQYFASLDEIIIGFFDWFAPPEEKIGLDMLWGYERAGRIAIYQSHMEELRVSRPMPHLRKLDIIPVASYLKSIHGLENLTGLESLTLVNIDRPDNLELIGRIPRLKMLNLNSLGITDEDLQHVNQDLIELDVGNTGFTDMSLLHKYPHLRRLNITGANTTVDSEHLVALKELESLNISSIDLSGGVEVLKGLSRLREVTAENASIIDPADFLALSNLEKLDLSGNDIEKIPLPRRPLSQLRHADFSNNPRLADVSGLVGAVGLREADFSGGAIKSLEPFRQLTHLETLTLTDNEIEDVSPLSGLIWLRNLDISENLVEDFNVLSNLSQLVELNVSVNAIVDMGFLKNMKRLESAILAENRIEVISGVSGLVRLRWLVLTDNEIWDIEGLRGASYLSLLSLQDNRIIDFSPLESLPNLEVLTMQRNDPEVTDFSFIDFLPKLEELEVTIANDEVRAFLEEREASWPFVMTAFGP